MLLRDIAFCFLGTCFLSCIAAAQNYTIRNNYCLRPQATVVEISCPGEGFNRSVIKLNPDTTTFTGPVQNSCVTDCCYEISTECEIKIALLLPDKFTSWQQLCDGRNNCSFNVASVSMGANCTECSLDVLHPCMAQRFHLEYTCTSEWQATETFSIYPDGTVVDLTCQSGGNNVIKLVSHSTTFARPPFNESTCHTLVEVTFPSIYSLWQQWCDGKPNCTFYVSAVSMSTVCDFCNEIYPCLAYDLQLTYKCMRSAEMVEICVYPYGGVAELSCHPSQYIELLPNATALVRPPSAGDSCEENDCCTENNNMNCLGQVAHYFPNQFSEWQSLCNKKPYCTFYVSSMPMNAVCDTCLPSKSCLARILFIGYMCNSLSESSSTMLPPTSSGLEELTSQNSVEESTKVTTHLTSLSLPINQEELQPVTKAFMVLCLLGICCMIVLLSCLLFRIRSAIYTKSIPASVNKSPCDQESYYNFEQPVNPEHVTNLPPGRTATAKDDNVTSGDSQRYCSASSPNEKPFYSKINKQGNHADSNDNSGYPDSKSGAGDGRELQKLKKQASKVPKSENSKQTQRDSNYKSIAQHDDKFGVNSGSHVYYNQHDPGIDEETTFSENTYYEAIDINI